MQLKYQTALVTGVAGFIGYHLCLRLLRGGRTVIGVDNLNDYYDVRLKNDRLEQLKKMPEFTFYQIDLENLEALKLIFDRKPIDVVVNLELKQVCATPSKILMPT